MISEGSCDTEDWSNDPSEIILYNNSLFINSFIY